MFIGGKTPAPTSPDVSDATVSSKRSISRRISSKSAKGLSNGGLEGPTRLTSMVDLLGLSARIGTVFGSLDARLNIAFLLSRDVDLVARPRRDGPSGDRGS